MSILLFANNIQTTLASSITSVQTSITLVSAAGLPNPSSGQYFVMTFTNGATNEVVWVTNVTGSVITCIRAQEGTSAQTFAAGSYASCFPTAGTMRDLVQIDQLQNGAYTFTNGAGTANALTATIASNLTVVPNGFQFILNASNANTNAATLNLTLNPTISGASPVSTGALPIFQNGTFPLTGGEITGANYLCLFTYNANYNGGGGAFVLENPYNPVTGVVGITQVQDQYFTYASSGGSTDALTVSLPAGLSALTDGAVVTFRNAISSNTTTTPTLNVTYGSTATGATVIKKYNNQALSAGDTGGVGYVCQLVYSSSNSAWMLLNPAPGAATGVTSLIVGNSGIGFSGYSGVSGYTGAVTAYNQGVLTINGSSGVAGAVTLTPASIGAVSLSSNTLASPIGIAVSAVGTQAFNITSGGFTGGISPTSIQLSTTGLGILSAVGTGITIVTPSFGANATFNVSGYNYQGNNGSAWATTSDIAVKTNISSITNSLEKINSLKPSYFEYKNDLGNVKAGFIAQEFSEVFPNLVHDQNITEEFLPFVSKNKKTIKAISPELMPYLVGAIKELNLKVAQLETTINIQAAYIAALQAKV